MPAIILPDRCKQRPIGPVEIDWTNPLAKGLRYFVLTDAVNYRTNLVNQQQIAVAMDSGIWGSGTSITTAQADGYQGEFSISKPDWIGSYAVSYRPILGSVCWMFSSATTWDGLYVDSPSAIRLTSNLGFAGRLTPTGNSTGGFLRVCASVPAANNFRAISGVGDVAIDTSAPLPIGAMTKFVIGGDYAQLNYCAAEFAYFAVWDAPLADDEMRAFNAQPYSVLRRKSRILYFPSAGGGGATYDEAVSETLAAVAASSTLADWLGTASESIATTSSQGNTWSGDVAAAMTLAVTTAEAGALETAATVAEAVAIVTAQAQDGAITVTVSETAGIVSTEAATASMAVAVAEAVATVSAQSGIATMAAVVGEAIAVVVDQFFTAASLDAAVSEAIAATTTISATVEIGGLVSEVISALSAESVTSVETATVAFTAGVIDAAIGGMIASGTVSELLSIATSESGSVITAEFRTPDGRTLSVQFDSRTLEVRKQIRTLLVSKSTIH